MSGARPVRLTLLAALALLAAAVGLTLLGSPMSVARTNKTPGASNEPIASTKHGATYCQPQETVPRRTTAIRVWLDATTGPRVRLRATSSSGQPITGGQRGSGWIGGSVTVPVKEVARTVSGATVCVSFGLRNETVVVQGEHETGPGAARAGGQALEGRMWIEYLTPGRRSWASLAPSIVRRMGLGRADPGSAIVVLALALLAGVIALTSNLVLKDIA